MLYVQVAGERKRFPNVINPAAVPKRAGFCFAYYVNGVIEGGKSYRIGQNYHVNHLGGFQIFFLMFSPKLEEDEPNLTIICFRWVG